MADVVVRRIEPILVASVRDVVPRPADQGLLWNELGLYLEAHSLPMADAPISLYHDLGPRESDWDIEVCMPIGDGGGQAAGLASSPSPDRARIRQLPEIEAACILHEGGFASILASYETLWDWVRERGRRLTGPIREVNLRPPAIPGDQDDPDTRVEIQFPI